MSALRPDVVEDRETPDHHGKTDDTFTFIGCVCGWAGVPGDFAEHIPPAETVHTRATGLGFEGWAHSRRWHYWRGDGTLCGRVYGYSFVRVEPGSTICAACRKSLGGA